MRCQWHQKPARVVVRHDKVGVLVSGRTVQVCVRGEQADVVLHELGACGERAISVCRRVIVTPELELLLSEIQQQIDAYESDDLLRLDIDRAPLELQTFYSRLQLTQRQSE